jgi:hypothetical protein
MVMRDFRCEIIAFEKYDYQRSNIKNWAHLLVLDFHFEQAKVERRCCGAMKSAILIVIGSRLMRTFCFGISVNDPESPQLKVNSANQGSRKPQHLFEH